MNSHLGAPDPIAARKAIEAAQRAGVPITVLTALSGNQLAKLILTMLNTSPLPFESDFDNEQLKKGTDEDGWTLTVRWKRPTDEDIAAAGRLGMDASELQTATAPTAPEPSEPTPPPAPDDDVQILR